jgi:hypothetical protein
MNRWPFLAAFVVTGSTVFWAWLARALWVAVCIASIPFLNQALGG